MPPRDSTSLATGQRSLGDGTTYALEPPLTAGCPSSSTGDVQYPLEVTYDYDALDPGLFDGPPRPGLERWAPLLPPLDAPGLGEGATPLVQTPAVADWAGVDREVYVKDESRNPTWSQKDRLNRPVVSAAVRAGADGVVVSSSGNHGASAAAYAARADLPCVVLTAPETPAAVQRFLAAYGATVLAVPDWHARQEAVDRLAERGFHAASSRTPVHTGHPWGPEGYKTIAYEVCADLGGAPGSVFAPTSFAELAYGAWRGFRELADLGVTDRTPRVYTCEPDARGPLAAAMASGETVTSVEPGDTEAYSIRATESTVRGRRAVEESSGAAVTFAEGELAAAGEVLAGEGLWQEASGAAGAAGLHAAAADDRAVPGPVVCLGTSSGFKDGETEQAPQVAGDWAAVRDALQAAGLDV